ncbi:MAG: tetratricopeptide repeat protein [Acidobacteria bacterium]|nr:tetratricopeptide repeat protein [Acidobacteriota bacterium]
MRLIAASAVALGLLSLPALPDYKQAVAYYMQGRYDKAIQEIKPDLDANPDWEFGHRLAGLSYLRLKNNALAISSLTRAVQLKSKAFSTYLGLGQAYFNMQRYDSCVDALNQGEPLAASEKEPEKERYKLLQLRGYACYQLQKFNEAVIDLQAAIRISGSDWADYSHLGIALYNVKRDDDALQALLKALALKPGHNTTTEYIAKAYFRKGLSALSAKQYDQSLDLLRKARDYNPRDGFVYYNMAEAYLFQKNFAEAEKSLNQALDLMPRSAEVLQRLGLIYEKQKKWDLSLSSYQRAYEITQSPGLKEAIDRVAELKRR